MVDRLEKTCTKCGAVKPLSEFYKHKKSPDGYAYSCNHCANLYTKKYRQLKLRNAQEVPQQSYGPQECRNEQKECTQCRVTKSLSEFSKDKYRKDGHVHECKSCRSAAYSRWDRAKRQDPSWESDYLEEKRTNAKIRYAAGVRQDPDMKAAYVQRNRHKYPEKGVARRAAQRCVLLKTPGNHRHHWSYRRQHHVDVFELSMKDHNLIHRFLEYDATEWMYRRKDTNKLLDSREAHQGFINEVLSQQSF